MMIIFKNMSLKTQLNRHTFFKCSICKDLLKQNFVLSSLTVDDYNMDALKCKIIFDAIKWLFFQIL